MNLLIIFSHHLRCQLKSPSLEILQFISVLRISGQVLKLVRIGVQLEQLQGWSSLGFPLPLLAASLWPGQLPRLPPDQLEGPSPELSFKTRLHEDFTITEKAPKGGLKNLC